MSDKLIKAQLAASQAAMKNRRIHDALLQLALKVCAKALIFSPSIVSYAGEQGGTSIADIKLL